MDIDLYRPKNERCCVCGLERYLIVAIAGLSGRLNLFKFDFMNTWIVADPEHLGGSPRVRDTRISVALILESLSANMSLAEIVEAYPSLTEESVRGMLEELAHRKEFQPA